MSRIQNVLWVDDDSPIRPIALDKLQLRTARSCFEAIELLDKTGFVPDVIVVDIVLPQNGWGGGYLETPGIELVRFFKQRFGGNMKIGIFTILVTAKRRDAASKAGADMVLSKTEHGLRDVVRLLSAGDAAQTGSNCV